MVPWMPLLHLPLGQPHCNFDAAQCDWRKCTRNPNLRAIAFNCNRSTIKWCATSRRKWDLIVLLYPRIIDCTESEKDENKELFVRPSTNTKLICQNFPKTFILQVFGGCTQILVQ